MLESVERLWMLRRSCPVSRRICPPGRVGLRLRCHAWVKNACRSKFWSNSSERSIRISFRMFFTMSSRFICMLLIIAMGFMLTVAYIQSMASFSCMIRLFTFSPIASAKNSSALAPGLSDQSGRRQIISHCCSAMISSSRISL